MRNIILTVALSLSLLSVCAQQQMTLGDCVLRAVESNYDVKIARSRQTIAKNNLVPTPFLPVLSANARQNQDVMNSRDVYDDAKPDVKQDYTANLYSADLGLSWRLFDGLSMFATYDTQRELLREGELNLKNSMESLVADVSQQYYYIVTQNSRLEASKLYLDISMMRYNQAKEKYLIGTISGLEMKQAKIDLNADSSKLVLQQQVISNAYIQLFEMMNLELTSEIMLRDTIVPNGELMLEKLSQCALEDNTSIMMARSGVRLSDLDLKIARARRYPTLDFNTAYRFNHSSNGLSTTRFNQLHGMNWGFTVSAKLFNGLEINRKIRNAKVEMQISDLTYKQTEQSIMSNVLQQFNIYRKNFMMIGFETESAESALLNLQAAMEMYRIGTLSGIAFREIQRSYLEAVERKLDALYQAKVSEISLLYLGGRLL